LFVDQKASRVLRLLHSISLLAHVVLVTSSPTQPLGVSGVVITNRGHCRRQGYAGISKGEAHNGLLVDFCSVEVRDPHHLLYLPIYSTHATSAVAVHVIGLLVLATSSSFLDQLGFEPATIESSNRWMHPHNGWFHLKPASTHTSRHSLPTSRLCGTLYLRTSRCLAGTPASTVSIHATPCRARGTGPGFRR
jgi:hypothetical protein